MDDQYGIEKRKPGERFAMISTVRYIHADPFNSAPFLLNHPSEASYCSFTACRQTVIFQSGIRQADIGFIRFSRLVVVAVLFLSALLSFSQLILQSVSYCFPCSNANVTDVVDSCHSPQDLIDWNSMTGVAIHYR